MIKLSLIKSPTNSQKTLLISNVFIPTFFQEYSQWQFKNHQTYSLLKAKGLAQNLLETSRILLLNADDEIIQNHPNRAKSMQARARRLTESSYILSTMSSFINDDTKIVVEITTENSSENRKKQKNIGTQK